MDSDEDWENSINLSNLTQVGTDGASGFSNVHDDSCSDITNSPVFGITETQFRRQNSRQYNIYDDVFAQDISMDDIQSNM